MMMCIYVIWKTLKIWYRCAYKHEKVRKFSVNSEHSGPQNDYRVHLFQALLDIATVNLRTLYIGSAINCTNFSELLLQSVSYR